MHGTALGLAPSLERAGASIADPTVQMESNNGDSRFRGDAGFRARFRAQLAAPAKGKLFYGDWRRVDGFSEKILDWIIASEQG